MDNNISKYDFKQSLKFSKKQLTVLSIFSEKFVTNSTLYLNEILNNKFNVNHEDIKQVTFDKCLSHMHEENKHILVEFELVPNNNSVDYIKNLLFRMDRKLILTMIDIMLGGNGNVKNIDRNLTSIDNKLISHLILSLIEKMNFHAEGFSVSIVDIYLNPSVYQNLHSSSFVSIIQFNISQEKNLGNFEFFLPYKKFQPIIDNISTKTLLQESDLKDDDTFSLKLSEKVKDINLKVSVEVGDKSIQLGDLLNLTKGTILKLNKKIKDPLDVYVEDIKTFESIPGLIGDKKAVSIIDNIKKGDKKHD